MTTTRPTCPVCGESKSYRNRPEGFRTWRPCGHAIPIEVEPSEPEVVPFNSSFRDEEPVSEEHDVIYDTIVTEVAEVDVSELSEDDPEIDIALVEELIKEGEEIMANADVNDAMEVVITYLRRVHRILTTGQLANSIGRETGEQLSAVIAQLPDSVGGKQVEE